MSNFKNFYIGKDIKSILLDSSVLTGYVDQKVFPLVAPVQTRFPFIVYKRTSYQDNGNKDYDDEIVFLEITIVSTKYEESVNIAACVADILVGSSNNNIDEILITDIQEEFIDDSYVQKIFFKIFLK